MKQCEDNLNISITYQNSLGASAEDLDDQLRLDIQRIIKNSAKENNVQHDESI